jgi:Xaa-Pro aminopeptidase
MLKSGAVRMSSFRKVTPLSARIALTLFVLCALCPTVSSQPPFDAPEFAARRARLMEQLGDGIALIFAADEHEHAIKFRQSPDFYYLTGIEEPGAILLLVGPSKQSIVFAFRRSAGKVRFEGPGIHEVNNAAKVYGLTAVQPMDNFLNTLNSVARSAKKVYLPLTPQDSSIKGRNEIGASDAARLKHPLYRYTPSHQQAADRIRELYPQLPLADISPLLDDMRWVKTPYEIERLRISGRIGAAGVKAAIRGTRPGMYEYELAAALRFVFSKMGVESGFPPIVASGPNTIVWHYLANNRQMQAGDVVLMDAGSIHDYYHSDITRTWPVSGRFTTEQEKMYRCVLEARNAIIAAMKPGVTIKQLQGVAEAVYTKNGYQKEFLSLNRYIGHPVGLSVHDVNPSDPSRPLEAGVVFNVEPILEFVDKKIHIRLEDTVLITPTAAENLTADVPVELEEIYALIKQKGISLN